MPTESIAAEAALLHQATEAAAAVLLAQQQPEPQQSLEHEASMDHLNSRQHQVRLHVASQCAGQ